MKNIIVPTDFSANAKNAFIYAIELAKELDGEITVVHYWSPDTAIAPGMVVDLNSDILTKAKATKLEAFVESVDTQGVACKTDVRAGFVGSSLVDLSNQDDVDLIVMGTNGESGIIEQMMGSISTHVSQHAHCPVCLVPPNIGFKPLKNVMYASDYDQSSSEAIERVVHLADDFKASVHLVHVSKDGAVTAPEDIVDYFNKVKPNVKFSLSTIQSDSLWESLDTYAHKHDMNLMVVVTRHRSFFERLLHKSNVKQMVFTVNVPMMVIHIDDKNEIW